ncbi:MAG: hypothetical protein HYS87_01735 [Candidatus Colwellbacteria bacterium]|nr:hypothetical protein [Candidatus Colwellbacteria bacterium]
MILLLIALAQGLVWDADQTINLTGPNVELTILSGSEADSLIVRDDDIQVVVANQDVFEVQSAGGELSVGGATSANITKTCSSGSVSKISISGGGDGETITIAPGENACSSGGGGGGGRRSVVPPPAPVPPPPAVSPVPAPFLCPNGNTVASNCLEAPVQEDLPLVCSDVAFVRNLNFGSVGEDVRCLQVLFNLNPAYKVADSGPGSWGLETAYFGPLTVTAAIKFQEFYASDILTPIGLIHGTGFIGPITRIKLNTLFPLPVL